MAKNVELEYKGEKYALVFNLNVMEVIQEEYGSVEEWGNLTETGEPNAKAIKFGLGAMLNEGVEIYNEDNQGNDDFVERKPFTLRQVGRIISEEGLGNIANKINKTVIDSTKSDEKNS